MIKVFWFFFSKKNFFLEEEAKTFTSLGFGFRRVA
jgi:hypothetical protein